MQPVKSLIATMLFVAASLSAPIATYAKNAPGVTDTEIKIGTTQPFSGPASAYSGAGKAAGAYMNMINEQGGINGRKINLIQQDDGFSPPKTLEQTRKLVEQDGVAFMAMQAGSITAMVVRKYLNDKKVPQLLVISSLSAWDDPKTYPWSMAFPPTFDNEAKSVAQYILKKMPDAKIGILSPNDDAGKALVKMFHDTLGPAASKMIVKEVTYELTDPTIDSQVVTLQAAGANVFINWTTPKQAAQAIRKAYDIGWKPAMQVLMTNSASVAQVLTPAGLEKSTGVVTVAFLKDPGPQWAEDKGYQEWLAFMKKYHPTGQLDQTSVYGYSIAQTLVQILKQCGNDLSRENIMKQAASLDMALPMLLPGIHVKTSATDFSPIDQYRLQKFDGKQWHLMSNE